MIHMRQGRLKSHPNSLQNFNKGDMRVLLIGYYKGYSENTYKIKQSDPYHESGVRFLTRLLECLD